MRVRILLQITDDAGASGAAEEIAVFEKATERPEDLGLLITEGKALLTAVQQKTVLAQVAAWSERPGIAIIVGNGGASKAAIRSPITRSSATSS